MRASLYENWESRNGLLLPRGYLSSSAMDLWEKDKPEFRERYYLGKKPPQTIYTRFGSEVHDKLYTNHPDVAFVPRFGEREHCVQVYIEGVPILGYIDEVSFVDADVYFDDTKTGLHPWTDSKVRKHEQLTFYATILQAKYGTVRHYASITWLETVTDEWGALALSKKFVKYPREIEQWEIDRQVKRIVRIANEISTDYRQQLSMI